MRYTVQQLKQFLTACNICSLDIEYDPNTEWQDEDFELHGMGVSTYNDQNEMVAEYLQSREDIQEILDHVLLNQIPVVGHYFGSDIIGFMGANYSLKKDFVIYGTEIAANMVHEELRQYGLKVLVRKYLKIDMVDFLDAADGGLDSEKFLSYAKRDVITQLSLYKYFEKDIDDLNLRQAFTIVCNSIQPFAEMQYFGVPIDPESSEELFHKILLLQNEVEQKIYEMIGYLDIGSHQQLRNRLFVELGYGKGLKLQETDSGELSTGEENMKVLAHKYPACEAIMAYRTCVKMVSTYLDKCNEQAYCYDGRFRERFNLVSATGRTRAKILQTFPKNLSNKIKFSEELKGYLNDLELRAIVKPADPDYVILAADLSSVEYRMAALVAPEPKMIEMYQTWNCEHCQSTGKSKRALHQCPTCQNKEEFTHGKDLHTFVMNAANRVGAGIDRNKAKNVSFCTIFYGTAGRLSQMLGLPRNLCQQIMDELLNEFPGIRKWHNRTALIAESTGEVRCIFNRRRKVDLPKRLRIADRENHYWVKKNAINELVNAPCQMGAGILAQRGMQKARMALIEKGWWGNVVKQINFVHDELVYECHKDVVEETGLIVQEAMEIAISCAVPIGAEYDFASDYGSAK